MSSSNELGFEAEFDFERLRIADDLEAAAVSVVGSKGSPNVGSFSASSNSIFESDPMCDGRRRGRLAFSNWLGMVDLCGTNTIFPQ